MMIFLEGTPISQNDFKLGKMVVFWLMIEQKLFFNNVSDALVTVTPNLQLCPSSYL